MVGDNVSDSSGSTISAKNSPISFACASARAGDAGRSPVTASSSASTSGVKRCSGTYSPSAVISGAALTSALSAMPGIEACPLPPAHAQPEGRAHLLRDGAHVERLAAELEPLARAFVDQVVAANRVGMGLAQPLRAEARADFLVGCRGEDQVACRLEAFPRERRERNGARRHLPLHVERAAAPDLAAHAARRRRDRRSTPLRLRARHPCATGTAASARRRGRGSARRDSHARAHAHRARPRAPLSSR